MTGRTVAENAELALLLEVAGTPKPGNVDRQRDFDGLRFEHFLAGAAGAREGLSMAADGAPVGESFERAVAGMADQRGGNTQFGALLMLVPLVRATAVGDLDQETAARVVSETTVEDAEWFYRAFDHVDVFVSEPPDEMEDLDVRRGSDAIPAVRDAGLTLQDVMERSVPGDGVAAEWIGGFERTFAAADWIEDGPDPILDAAADAFLRLLADEPDTFVAKHHDEETARWVSERAAELVDASREDVEVFATNLVEGEINPGTTADITAAALFVALERGVPV